LIKRFLSNLICVWIIIKQRNLPKYYKLQRSDYSIEFNGRREKKEAEEKNQNVVKLINEKVKECEHDYEAILYIADYAYSQGNCILHKVQKESDFR